MNYLIVYLAYLGVSALVASLGVRRKFGVWGYFFASLLFTPLIGLLLVLASDPKPEPLERLKPAVSPRAAGRSTTEDEEA